MFRFAQHDSDIFRFGLFRLVRDFKNDLPARVTSRYLLLRLHRFQKWECLSRLQFSERAIDGAGAPSRRHAAARGRALFTYCVLASV